MVHRSVFNVKGHPGAKVGKAVNSEESHVMEKSDSEDSILCPSQFNQQLAADGQKPWRPATECFVVVFCSFLNLYSILLFPQSKG